MGKTFSIKVLFGIYLLLIAGKVFAFSCNVDGGSSIGAGTTSVYVNLDPVIQPGQNLVVDLSQHISCWNEKQSTSGFKRNLWTNRKQGCSRSRPVSHWCHFYL